MKSAGNVVSGIANVVVTGSEVPLGKNGILNWAFDALTTVSPCNPIPVSAISTVIEFWPAEIDVNAARLPGNTSVTINDGVQVPGVKIGEGVGNGVGLASVSRSGMESALLKEPGLPSESESVSVY